MENKLLTVLIGAVVGIIALTSVLMPILADSASDTITYHNDGAYYVTSELPYVMEIDNGIYTINGEVMPLSLTQEYSLLVADKFVLRNYNNTLARPIVFAAINDVSTSIYTIKVEVDQDLHATVTRVIDGTPTISEFDLTFFYGITPEKTDKVMTSGNSPIYVNADSVFYVAGRTNITQWSNIFEVTGTIEAPTVTAVRGTATLTDVVANYEVIEGKSGYLLESITFNANGTPCVYNRMIVDESVTMGRTDAPLLSEKSLIYAIPVLLIVGMLTMIVSVVRKD